jgi:type VI secretion system protein ImpA
MMDTQVSQLTRLTQLAQVYFLDAAMPAGRSVRGSAVYSAIENARRHDDDSLPRGAWERELKRAEWDSVSTMTVDALRHKSKDLQLAGWLLEAQIHQHGFQALAPCLLLLNQLCQRYWHTLHPQADDGDLEFRANILRWTADKLLPTLRLLPVVGDGRDGHYCLADWDTAKRNEQMRAALARDGGEQPGGVGPEQLQTALHGAATEACLALQEALDDALAVIALLMHTLDERFGADGPGFGKMVDLLEQMRCLLAGELQRRGGDQMPHAAAAMDAAEPAMADGAAAQAPAPAGAANLDGAIRDRNDAYARLAEAAAYLCRVEPHSPAPYLVKRAIEWGRLNTTDLYQELFIKLGGTLNIFELLGLETSEQGEKS